MDPTTNSCDPYVKPQLKGVSFEPPTTQTAKKTLNPVWNELLKCDIADDCVLLDEPIQLRVFDKDTFTQDDVIGTVYVFCSSLYEGLGKIMSDEDSPDSKQDNRRREIHGWFPIYDSMRGICGELKVVVHIQHIMDFNPVEDSSVGVPVLSSSSPPEGFYIAELHGMVDELLVEDDPESDWQDNFRSCRVSNDARQLLLHTMDGRLG
eukprot:CAMPEP_0113716964 /NCGR_PEP_ID=MMETSP0038_2-20120614/34224_1 /TAXON_ID=2898 /ORGANISM="Cryptomonas paramecium" /LENGTH=206 /DNA_ID=CAMNT_0000644629 /DNA_START=90 /DNA_END=707 /DNA_ORIENTATION=- /assembly_acc=CAM_ASM_000170